MFSMFYIILQNFYFPRSFLQVLGVLLVILSSMDSMVENDFYEIKTQRHFNKAMAMRSLRGLSMSQKNPRLKKV